MVEVPKSFFIKFLKVFGHERLSAYPVADSSFPELVSNPERRGGPARLVEEPPESVNFNGKAFVRLKHMEWYVFWDVQKVRLDF